MAQKSGIGRYCCKSPFAPLIKNFPGRGGDFRVKIRGTSSPAGKLTVDLSNAIEATKIDDRQSDCPAAGKLSLGDFRLLQQYRPISAVVSSRRPCPLLGHELPSQNRNFDNVTQP